MVIGKSYKIATIGSHSALQILKGAQQEGFKTICVCIKGREKPYKQFKVADKIITINNFKDFEKTQDQLIKENAIIIRIHVFMPYYRISPMSINYFNLLAWHTDYCVLCN